MFDPLTGKSLEMSILQNRFQGKGFDFVKSPTHTQKGVYVQKEGNGFNCKNLPFYIFTTPASHQKNSIFVASKNYDMVNVFPSTDEFFHLFNKTIQDSKQKVNKDINNKIINIVYLDDNKSIIGAFLSIENGSNKNTIKKNEIWKINFPNDCFNVKIHSTHSDYYVDKTKMIFESKHYQPYNLNNVVVISYMKLKDGSNTHFNLNKSRNNNKSSEATFLFVDTNTGKILKTYTKQNVLKTVPLVVNLVRNLCSVIYTSSRTNSSIISTISFFYDVNKTLDTKSSYEDRLLVFRESYFLATHKISYATFSKTRFGFSHVSLILIRQDGRIQTIPLVIIFF